MERSDEALSSMYSFSRERGIMDYTAYINILKDTLKKKIHLLDELLEETHRQADAISSKEVDVEAFQHGMERKEPIISQLNKIDDGFELVYEKFGIAIKENKQSYREDILELQNYIRKVMEKSTLLQSIEKSNKEKFEKYLYEKKVEVKAYKVNNQVVGNYYKNMSDGYQNESIFLDKKK